MPDNIEWEGAKVENLTRDATKRGIKRATIHLERDVKLSLKKKGQGSNPGEPPQRQTGHLASSIGHEFDLDGLVGRVGTNLVYGRIHELGGVIHAKNVKFLTIPLNNKARKLLRKAGGTVRNIQGLVFIRSGGKRFLAMPNKGGLQFLFKLQPTVKIPPRPYLRPALDRLSRKADKFFKDEL